MCKNLLILRANGTKAMAYREKFRNFVPSFKPVVS